MTNGLGRNGRYDSDSEKATRPQRLIVFKEWEDAGEENKEEWRIACFKHPNFPSAFLKAKRERRPINGIVKVKEPPEP